MLGNQTGTQGTTIYSPASCVLGSFHSSTPVSRPGGAAAMARLGLPVFLLLCFSLLRLGSGRPPRTRKALSPRQSAGNPGELHKCSSCQPLVAPQVTRRVCVCVCMLLWGCRGRRRQVPDREAVAGGQLPEGDAGAADRYDPTRGEESVFVCALVTVVHLSHNRWCSGIQNLVLECFGGGFWEIPSHYFTLYGFGT